VEAALAHFSQSKGHFPAANWMAVSPTSLRITGPQFEEYEIRAAGGTRNMSPGEP